tara:strand:- start:2824 stop:3426 length:603 start_codon:yes stop_codon:yes gene_type:complete
MQMSINDPNGSQASGNTAQPNNLQDQAGQDLDSAAGKAKHDLDAVGMRAKDDVRELGHKANEKISEATDSAKSFADDQKNMAAGQIKNVADAIAKVAYELDGEQPTVARYARDLGAGLSSAGKTVQDHDVDDLMGMAQDFGRKQPVAFLGAAALAGFVASRFALASSHRRDNKSAAAQTGVHQPTAPYGSDPFNPGQGER